MSSHQRHIINYREKRRTLQKLPFLVQVPNFTKKNNLGTHVTVGSCSRLVWEYVEKNSEISTIYIAIF